MVRKITCWGVFIIMLMSHVPVSANSYTDPHAWSRNIFVRDRNPRKPKTIPGVMNAYHSFVTRKNGIDQTEAKIIAQYRLIEDDHYRDFDFRKPKIIDQTGDAWSVRFPGKYSLTHQKVNNFIYIIRKADGAVIQTQISE